MNFTSHPHQATEAHNPNRCPDKGFPHKELALALERMYGHRDGMSQDGFSNVFDFKQWFDNQLGDLIKDLTDTAIATDMNHSRFVESVPIKYSYTFTEKYPQEITNNRDAKTRLILRDFACCSIRDFLMTIGIQDNTISIGETTLVNNGYTKIVLVFDFTPDQFFRGLETYSNTIRIKQKEEEFREAVFNINNVILPRLNELHSLGHNLSDIDKIFTMVNDLHNTFVKPKDTDK